MNKEIWQRWLPHKNITGSYYIDKIVDNIKKFEIFLINAHTGKDKITVIFEYGVDVYRNTEERYRLKLLSKLSEEYPDDLLGDWTFFKAKNSDYIKWLSVESEELSDFFLKNAVHYCFMTNEGIFEAISEQEPKVIFSNI
jgi:hypothetical protein